MIDPMDLPAVEASKKVHVDLPTNFEPDLYFDGFRFMMYLNGRFDFFDVATYSLSKAHGSPLKRVRRLIHGLRGIGTVRPKEHRLIENNHVKLFICYKEPETVSAIYLGSQNLSHGTNMNIMYLVQEQHFQPLLDFFNLLWQKSYPSPRQSSLTTPPMTPTLLPSPSTPKPPLGNTVA